MLFCVIVKGLSYQKIIGKGAFSKHYTQRNFVEILPPKSCFWNVYNVF